MPMLAVAHFWRLEVAARGGISLAGFCWSERFLSSRKPAPPQAVPEDRITSFLHPEEDAKGSGYQLLQSKIAVVPAASGQRVWQRQSESTGLHPRAIFGFHHVGVAEEQGFKGVLLALGLYMRFCYA